MAATALENKITYLADEHFIFEKSKVPRPAPPAETGSEVKKDDSAKKKNRRGGAIYRGPIYCRSSNASRRKLEKTLLNLYGRGGASSSPPDKRNADGSFSASIFPSGMAAIGAVLSSTLGAAASRASTSRGRGGTATTSKKPILVHGNELYSDVFKTIKYMEQTQGAETMAVNVLDRDAIIRLFSSHGHSIQIFHYEAASNPSSQMLDVSTVIPELRQLAPDCVFICDNTWLSVAVFNPLDHGADIVVESMTKYLSGGTCIGGMAVGHAKAMKPVQEYVRVMGLFVDAERCQFFSTQIKLVRERVTRSAKAAFTVAKWLHAQHQRVVRVDYPLLQTHASYEVATKLLKTMGLGPGCVWFMLPVSKSKYLEVASQNECPIEFKTSFGGPKSRLDPWPKADTFSSGSDDSQSKKKKVTTKVSSSVDGTPAVWVRLSLGFDERPEETIGNLETLFGQLGL